MEYEEYRQLRAYSRYDGIYLAILWLASFALTVMTPPTSIGGSLSTLLILITPFFVAWRLRKYREEGLGGTISFKRALLYCVRVFFNASLFFAICQWAYMYFLDGGRLLRMYETLLNAPEMQAALQAVGMSSSEMNAAAEQMFTPVYLASYSFFIGFTSGIILSLLIAAIMQRRG